jgi:hypothetical protein
MPTVKRSNKGIEMKPGSVSVRASEQLNTTVLDEVPDEPNTQSSARFREHCEVTKPPSPEPTSKVINGMEWTPLDLDRDGFAHTYVCEGRAMKIALNLRRERGEAYQEGVHEWVLFRMGQVIGRSRSLDDIFETAALS